MGAVEHALGFFDRAEEAEGARDERDIVVDRLWHSNHGECVATFARFLVKIVRATLRAVAADREENVYPARDEVIDRATNIDRPAR